jgi:predicted PhzF superfamily epimerase YddE/YHI9
MAAASSAPFIVSTAFSTNPFGGNPALVVFLDPATVPFKTLHGISLNFNQPMACFVKPFGALEAGQTEIHTDIQFVPVTGKDVGLCGHGSLASAKAILSLPEYKEKGIEAIHFRTVNNRGTITVRVLGEDRLEVELPASPPVPVSSEAKERIADVVNRAFSREVKINSILEGGETFKHGQC